MESTPPQVLTASKVPGEIGLSPPQESPKLNAPGGFRAFAIHSIGRFENGIIYLSDGCTEWIQSLTVPEDVWELDLKLLEKIKGKWETLKQSTQTK